MWPFSKDSGALPRKPKPDDWVLGRGERDGFPMIVRMANAYIGLAPLPGYDHHVIVSVHLRNPQPSGFPSPEEGDDLEALEMNLCRVIEADNDSFCVLVVTNNGLRDFIFYTRNVDSVKRQIEDAAVVFGGFEVEFWIEPDATWEIYQQFCRWFARAGVPGVQN
jgi:hypothetical protein